MNKDAARRQGGCINSILVLEDCEDLLMLQRYLIEALCERQAVLARSFADVVSLGDAALGCELAFLDINLGPDQPSGLDVYRWLRDHGFTRRIYFLTGHGPDFPAVATAVSMGSTKVLSKPLDPRTLVKIIRDGHASEP